MELLNLFGSFFSTEKFIVAIIITLMKGKLSLNNSHLYLYLTCVFETFLYIVAMFHALC